MTATTRAILLAAVAVLALTIGSLLRFSSREDSSASPPATAASLLQATLPDLSGQPQQLAMWKGKVLVVNFWATWCLPCREEIPALIRAQEKLGPKGLQIVGIAIDGSEQVRPYARDMRINYPILVGELDAMDLARQAGNGRGELPFTLVIDRSGRPVHIALGGLSSARLESIVLPLL